MAVLLESADRVHRREALLGPVRHRDRDGAVQLDDGGGLEPEQLAVEGDDLRPVARVTRMARGDRSLELVGTGLPAPEGRLDEGASLLDLVLVPEPAVLILEQDEPTGSSGISAPSIRPRRIASPQSSPRPAE
jgi:hypothetical protein